jgi:DNA-binding NarL/FixJ family response regulator
LPTVVDAVREPEPVKIVLADDHAMVRAGLRRLLNSQPGLTVVAEAADVTQALRLTREHQPRIVALDLHMPGEPTLASIPEFIEAAPGCSVLILTMEDEPALARTAIGEGAAGYVLKEAAEEELVEAVRALLAGSNYLDPKLGARLASGDGRAPAGRAGQELATGSVFAGHRINDVLGHGGMGVVYRATDLTLDREVALKVIATAVAGEPLFRERFERECRLAARIDHPHAVDIFHAGEEEGRPYLTMRYVRGTDLRQLLVREGPIDPRRSVALLTQIAGALDEAHGLGLVHRDVKPANVLVENRPQGEHAFLTDFGLTKAVTEESVTRTAIPLGTVDYISPEQAQGADADARSDIYSLGGLAFHLFTGSVPFPRENDLAKLWSHVHDPPPKLRSLRPELPGALEAVIERSLAKVPDERQQSASELARAAAAAIAGGV